MKKSLLLLVIFASVLLPAQSVLSGKAQVKSGKGIIGTTPFLPQYSLTVTVGGTGTVTASPIATGGANLNCPPQCTVAYGTGTTVTLSENPGTGQTFSGWGGACSGGASTCTLVMSGNQSVTASFSGGGGGGGPTAYDARIDSCNYLDTWGKAGSPNNCSLNASCSSVCDPSAANGHASALLHYVGGPSDPLPFFPVNDTGGPGGTSRGWQNNTWIDPDSNAYYVWVTDNQPAHVNGTSAIQSHTLGSDGGYDAWNNDSTLLTTVTTSGVQLLFHVIPSRIHAQTVTPTNPGVIVSQIKSGNPDPTHFDSSAADVFPRSALDANNILYELQPTLIQQLTINMPTSGGIPTGADTITRSTVVDFTSDAHGACSVLPPGYVSLWNGQGNVSSVIDAFTLASGGGPPWPGAFGITPGTPSQPVNSDTFILPTNNLTGSSAAIASVSSVGIVGTLVATTSLNAVVGESLDISGATGGGASYWNGNTFVLLTVNNSSFTYTFKTTSGSHPTSTTGTATWLVRVNSGYQATTAGTTGSAGHEPDWTQCPVLGTTCTDNTAVWTNIGPIGGQGPGFDIMNYRPGVGCTRCNTRTGRCFKGHGNYGATVTSVATAGGTSFTFTLATPETVYPTQTVTYTAGGDATFNGDYTVATIPGTNPVSSFTATGASHAAGSSANGTASEPWGQWLTDDASVCLLQNGTNCGTGGVVPFNDRMTLHGGSQPLDSRFGFVAPTGAGGLNTNWGTLNAPLSPVGNGSCNGSNSSNSQFLGVWNNSTVYGTTSSIVTYNGIFYKLIAKITGTGPFPTPDTDAAHWAYDSGLCYEYFNEWATGLIQPCNDLGPQYGCDSHQVTGFHFVYKGGRYFNHFYRHPNCQTVGSCPFGASTSYIGGPNPGYTPGFNLCSDVHPTYRNVGLKDVQPYLMPTSAQPSWPLFIGTTEVAMPCATYNWEVGYQNLAEVALVTPPGTSPGTPLVYRFGPNYNTGISTKFSIQSAIGDVSQDGAFLAFGSDFGNTRGDGTNVDATCEHQLRAQYQPAVGNSLTVGDDFFVLTENAVYTVVSCGGVTTPGTSCTYSGPVPDYSTHNTTGSASFCSPTSVSGNPLNPPCPGGAELEFVGQNSCKGDVAIIDLSSAHVTP